MDVKVSFGSGGDLDIHIVTTYNVNTKTQSYCMRYKPFKGNLASSVGDASYWKRAEESEGKHHSLTADVLDASAAGICVISSDCSELAMTGNCTL